MALTGSLDSCAVCPRASLRVGRGGSRCRCWLGRPGDVSVKSRPAQREVRVFQEVIWSWHTPACRSRPSMGQSPVLRFSPPSTLHHARWHQPVLMPAASSSLRPSWSPLTPMWLPAPSWARSECRSRFRPLPLPSAAGVTVHPHFSYKIARRLNEKVCPSSRTQSRLKSPPHPPHY